MLTVISESMFLQNKYGVSGIYGDGLEINSLNFEDHKWIVEGEIDPYKSLPQVFPEYDNETLESVETIENLKELRDGEFRWEVFFNL